LAQFSEVATLYSDNPDYWNSIAGASPTPAMVAKDLEAGEVGRFPKLGFFDAHQQLIGVCYLNRDFLAAHVWHIEFFLVSSDLRGTGASTEILQELECWIQSQGGQWLRLGSVTTDKRANRFWNKQGFTDLGHWQGRILQQSVTLQLKFKSLTGGTLENYLQALPNDRLGFSA
jgi:GNAT superfamily N-acetyltransferase